ncbi:DUF3168 domain-containing protein [Hymenobacter sp. HMF4947]|uniref:DUF3168 domain-containing protein n=1 Tax=Hymenobacter ginkgonis TaxID=2682976 RepID=A0A7K1TKM2_9BACT|nr:DUF3168 domain-containing protein [Hymenobacter ginkgonis]MVN78922.1 DUF3168 domain-containing protein [Hymenobacter ginkgonis]
MEPGALLNSLLSQAPAVVALVGKRIYPLVAPQGTPRPYCCYQLINRGPEAGSSKTCQLGDVARVQLSLFADTYEQLAVLTSAFRTVLDYAEPEPGVSLEIDNQQDHHDPQAACLFRSLDYLVELP